MSDKNLAKETPKQYSARNLARRIELAKAAVMEVQNYINQPNFCLNPNGFQELADAAFNRLDVAWCDAKRFERPAQKKDQKA